MDSSDGTRQTEQGEGNSPVFCRTSLSIDENVSNRIEKRRTGVSQVGTSVWIRNVDMQRVRKESRRMIIQKQTESVLLEQFVARTVVKLCSRGDLMGVGSRTTKTVRSREFGHVRTSMTIFKEKEVPMIEDGKEVIEEVDDTEYGGGSLSLEVRYVMKREGMRRREDVLERP